MCVVCVSGVCVCGVVVHVCMLFQLIIICNWI